MGTINREWHLAHLMPKKPTAQQRLDWHIDHAAHCTCRPFSVAMRNKLEEEVRKSPRSGGS